MSSEAVRLNVGVRGLPGSVRMCDKVDVYGFNSKYNKHDASEFPYHYYDEAEGITGTHSFDLTMRIIEIVQAQFPGLHIH